MSETTIAWDRVTGPRAAALSQQLHLLSALEAAQCEGMHSVCGVAQTSHFEVGLDHCLHEALPAQYMQAARSLAYDELNACTPKKSKDDIASQIIKVMRSINKL